MRTIISISTLLALAGCGGAMISPELRAARDTVDRARSGEAARLDAETLRSAEETLAAAEAAPDGSEEERTLAYVADRQARIAIANGTVRATQIALTEEEDEYRDELEQAALDQSRELERMSDELAQVQRELTQVRTQLQERGFALDARSRQLTERERQLAQREQEIVIALEAGGAAQTALASARSELTRVRRELDQVRSELDRRTRALDDQTRQLAQRERELALRQQELQTALEARAAAERRAEEAMSALRELASVRQDGDATIITLSGEVLFEYDQATLRPTARRRLRAVADALKASPNAMIVVEGHTDSVGSDQYNEQLSQRRAEAVRVFLVEEGVDAARIRAEGRGEAEPVADNDSPEGRANNRRVEIVFTPGAVAELERRRSEQQRQAQQPRSGARTGG